MKKLINGMQYTLQLSDSEYTAAKNYQNVTLFNFPVTIQYNGDKFILSCGSDDRVEVYLEKGRLYIVSSNMRLVYLGLQVLNIETGEEEGDVFLNETDLNCSDNYCYEAQYKSEDKRLKILCEYL